MKTGRPKVPRVKSNCLICGTEFEKRVTSEQKYCSSNCSKKMWTVDRRKQQSTLVRSKVDDEYRERCASANRGVKFDQSRIDRIVKLFRIHKMLLKEVIAG